MNLAIIGPGLLGASLGLVATRWPDAHVRIWGRRAEAVDELRRRKVGHLASTKISEVVEGADLVILCVPIGVMSDLVEEILPALKRGAIVTDVGSVKGPVVQRLEEIIHGHAHFVGAHPMAGSEQQGMDAAREDLYRGSLCIVTPSEKTLPEAAAHVGDFWRRVGCRVCEISPAEHDTMVAAVSHVPHLLAAVLVEAVAAQNHEAFRFVGPGFRDTTRIASGGAEMWCEILASNADAVRKSTEVVIEKLRHSLTLLDSAAHGSPELMTQFLTKAKAQRDLLRAKA